VKEVKEKKKTDGDKGEAEDEQLSALLNKLGKGFV